MGLTLAEFWHDLFRRLYNTWTVFFFKQGAETQTKNMHEEEYSCCILAAFM